MALPCQRFGGEGACPRDAGAPRSDEGAALAALLPVLLGQRTPAGLGQPEFDMGVALRLAAAEGLAPQVAAVLAAAIQSGVRAAQRAMAEHARET